MKVIKLSSIALLILLVSCEKISTDLNVENLEHPNYISLITNPVAINEKAGTILNRWFMAVHSTSSPAFAMGTMADINTTSWGCSSAWRLSSEPREAFNNKTSYGVNVTRGYFNTMYSILNNANAILTAIKSNIEIENPRRLEMMAKLGQALSVGYLALVFERVWLSDEDGVVSGDVASTYREAMNFALSKLDDAIEITKTNDVSFPDEWLPGGGGASDILVQFMNSMGARMLVGNVRNSAQKTGIDWNKVLAYTNNGITEDFTIFMDDKIWYALVPHTYMLYPGWGRVDMRIVNMMDPNTPDYWADDIENLPESSSVDARLVSDYKYLSSNNFRASRGKYHFSSYRYSRYDSYITNWVEDITEYSLSENDMYKAEALLNIGDVAGAADVVNAGTRVMRGKLPPVAANIEAVYTAIHYERMVEFAYTGFGIGFFEMRKEDLLQAGTLLHFPIPGRALEAIPEPYYTFGGTEGVAGEDYSIGGWK